jgi:S-formylglutathione hydrolase FrmB
MIEWLLAVRIDQPKALSVALGVTIVLFAILAVRPHVRRWIVPTLVSTVVAAGAGILIVWLVGDVWDVFDFTFSGTFRLWVALLCAGVTFAAMSFRRTRLWRKFVAAAAILCTIATSVLFVNADFGEYRTISEMFTPKEVPALSLPGQASADAADVATPGFAAAWTPPADMPATGSLGEIKIPATVSHFDARNAVVYLPPAARVATPPKLPVMVMLSGQPGAPDDLFVKGGLGRALDSYAAAHKGLAPIIVVPDQLGDPEKNPLCVDSPLGNSATYITQDVTAWIRANLSVTTDHRYWGVGGFSQGATCTTQFGPAHPDLYRTWFDIAGEQAPTLGDNTVRDGFGGSQAAYDAAKPAAILAKNAPYTDVAAIIGYGSLDTRLGPETQTIEAAMKAAGVSTTEIVSPGTAHDWNTVTYVFDKGVPVLAERLGLKTP